MRLLFKYPTRGRPDWFRETLERYRQLLSGENECHFAITMDSDDHTMNNEAIHRYLSLVKDVVLVYHYGDHANKVEACNAGMPESHLWDIVILVSDDMVVTKQDFDKIIVADMIKHFPNMDGVLHYPDGYRPPNDPVVTWTVMGRGFYERYGCLYRPEYKAMWCDDELTDVAASWGKLVHCDAEIVKHEWCKFGIDENYQRDHKLFAEDNATYEERKEKGFPRVFSDGRREVHP